MMSFRTHLFAAATLLGSQCSPAAAHPHVWVVLKSEIVYDTNGSVTAVHHAWTFDEAYSVFALGALQGKQKGAFTREELAPLAKENIESVKEADYFTQAKLNGADASFGDPTEYWFEYSAPLLTLHFTLPLKSPTRVKTLELAVYDPLYLVDFTFATIDAVVLSGAPQACKLTLSKNREVVSAPGQRPADAYFSQIESKGFGWQFASNIYVKCP